MRHIFDLLFFFFYLKRRKTACRIFLGKQYLMIPPPTGGYLELAFSSKHVCS
jgi:hypothetical protein